ncbi:MULTISPECIES: PqqD family protein [Rathayibacter]|uniref:PqqD family protein n=1 Tax=Rathayibacter TaxID=33886 RepID=UPI0010D36FB2|nr:MULTISPECIES: PqqD family protein [Rathayibacter]TDX78340.1 coenzyme PQQ synthesis protein D (PqqD) [Rathayibacter sp. PhB151]
MESIAVVEETERVTVLDLVHDDARPIVLTGSALAVWNEIDGESDQSEITRRLASTFDQDAAGMLEDVAAFLRHLESAHVIRSFEISRAEQERRAS